MFGLIQIFEWLSLRKLNPNLKACSFAGFRSQSNTVADSELNILLIGAGFAIVAANLVYAQAASYNLFDRLTSVLVFLAILAFVIRYVMFFLVNTAVGKHRTNYHFNTALVTCLTAFVLFLHNAIPGTSFINSIRDYVLIDPNASSTGFRVFWADYLWCLIYGLSASTLTYLKTLIQYSSGQAKPQKPIRTFFNS